MQFWCAVIFCTFFLEFNVFLTIFMLLIPTETMTTATSPILLKWDPKNLEIRTLTVERLLEPLVTQVDKCIHGWLYDYYMGVTQLNWVYFSYYGAGSISKYKTRTVLIFFSFILNPIYSNICAFISSCFKNMQILSRIETQLFQEFV